MTTSCGSCQRWTRGVVAGQVSSYGNCRAPASASPYWAAITYPLGDPDGKTSTEAPMTADAHGENCTAFKPRPLRRAL